MATPLLELRDVSVSLQGREVLHNINWCIERCQNWLLRGRNGSGKSTLLRLVRGDIWPDVECRQGRMYYTSAGAQHSPLGFREKTALVSADLQLTYQRLSYDLTVEQAIATGFYQTRLPTRSLSADQEQQVGTVLRQCGLQSAIDRPVRELSEGELRRVLLARALVAKPILLLLDEFLDGIDANSVTHMVELIEESGCQWILCTHRDGHIPHAQHETLYLEGGRITTAPPAPAQATTRQPTIKPIDYETIFEVENCDVYRGRQKVLQQVNWTMRGNENWLITGANGSGKSTLLNLLYGSLPSAYGGSIVRFGDATLKKLADVHKRIAWLSTTLQGQYHYPVTAKQLVISGLRSTTGIYHDITPAETEIAETVMKEHNLWHLRDESIAELSYGQVRRLLLARCLMGAPSVLLLDEPFNGLDQESRLHLQTVIAALSADRLRVVMTSHHSEDVLPTINRVAEITNQKLHPKLS